MDTLSDLVADFERVKPHPNDLWWWCWKVIEAANEKDVYWRMTTLPMLEWPDFNTPLTKTCWVRGHLDVVLPDNEGPKAIFGDFYNMVSTLREAFTKFGVR